MTIRLWREVRGDWPIGHHVVAEARIYGEDEVKVNPYGAVSVKTPNGFLGLRPNEYEPVMDWPLKVERA